MLSDKHRVEVPRKRLAERADAEVLRDMAVEFAGGQAEIAERSWYAAAGMICNQKEWRRSAPVDDQPRRWFVSAQEFAVRLERQVAHI